MPTVNVFFKNDTDLNEFETITSILREYLADKLSVPEKQLTPQEISIRLVNTSGGKMMANVEVEITAHAYPERIAKQDQICLETAAYIKQKIPNIEIQVWLKLCELGHSWQS